MRRRLFLLMIVIFAAAAFAQKNVAVLEIDRHPDIHEEISRREAMEITNVIRAEAVNTLPRGRYSVMTSETIMSMGGAVAADCADENCVITIGRRIDADYIVRGTLSKFQTRYTLNIEMFETDYGNLVATAAPVRSANLEEILEKSASACVDMYRKFLNDQGQAAPQTPAPPQTAAPAPAPVAPPPPPPPPVTYALTVRRNPLNGGTVSVNPDLPRYNAGTRVALTATPADGYRFTGWTQDNSRNTLSTNLTLNGTMTRDITFTANFKALPPPKPEPAARTARQDRDKGSPLKLTLRISTGALAVGGIVGGLVYHLKADSEYEAYESARNESDVQDIRINTENYASTANVLYILGGLGLSGFAVSFFF